AGAEIDDLDPLAPHPLGLHRPLHGRRHADLLHPFREHRHYAFRIFRACCFSRSRASTASGTRPATEPPSDATSLTSRELTYVYCSAGIMKTVSTSGLRCRFMRAVCISYSKSETALSPRAITFAWRSFT